MYVYCLNNPSDMIDITGCWPTWSDVWKTLKKAIDNSVHSALYLSNPWTTTVVVMLHYNRNILNDEYTEAELMDKYKPEDRENDKFHQNHQQGNKRNRKYVIGEWFSSEVVFYDDGTLNNTPEDRGTFNIYSGDNKLFKYIVHGYFDVIPYMIWGNSYDDSTTIIDRLIMIGE